MEWFNMREVSFLPNVNLKENSETIALLVWLGFGSVLKSQRNQNNRSKLRTMTATVAEVVTKLYWLADISQLIVADTFGGGQLDGATKTFLCGVPSSSQTIRWKLRGSRRLQRQNKNYQMWWNKNEWDRSCAHIPRLRWAFEATALVWSICHIHQVRSKRFWQ